MLTMLISSIPTGTLEIRTGVPGVAAKTAVMLPATPTQIALVGEGVKLLMSPATPTQSVVERSIGSAPSGAYGLRLVSIIVIAGHPDIVRALQHDVGTTTRSLL